MAKAKGHRNLALIQASGSTARVLNLALVHERFGETPEFTEKPMFQSKVLNRVLILKHVVRSTERHLFEGPPRSNTTKIVAPFASKELQLGGRSMLFGEHGFEKVLRAFANPPDDAAFEADLELIRLLDTLPSFDPFLMRERMRQSGYEVAQCFFDMSPGDVTRMRSFVSKEIQELVGLAYAGGGAAAQGLATRLADKLMTDETAKPLDPLRAALGLSDEDYREGVFAWKGFLYYRWLADGLMPRLRDLSRDVLTARVTGLEPASREQLVEMRKRVVRCISQASERVEEALLDYGSAFAGLTAGNVKEFRDFLLRAPDMFIPIGEAIGVIKHIESFWRFRFPTGETQVMDEDEAFEIFGDFDATLRSMEVLNAKPKEAEVAVI